MFPASRRSFPSNPRDAKGLLIAAIEDDDPVVFFEPKRLYNGPFDGHHERPASNWSKHPLGDVPDGHYTVPIGKASVFRPGSDLTILTYGTMVYVAEAAVNETGIDGEIVDLRTLLPLDIEAIAASVQKTGRCMVLHEATLTSGFGAELSARIQETCFYHLEVPVERVTGWDTPLPARTGMGLFSGPGAGWQSPEIHDGGRVMGVHEIRMPDVGEGITEAEIVEWNVAVGDLVREDDILAAVMTDKATVEIPSPVEGKVSSITGTVGEMTAVGATIITIEVSGAGNAEENADKPVSKGNDLPAEPKSTCAPANKETGRSVEPDHAASEPARLTDAESKPPRPVGEKPLASPAVRKRAREAGIQLQYVHGSGPAGRIVP